MNELEKQAAKKDLTEAFNRHLVEGTPENWVVGRQSKLSRGLGHAVYGPTAAVASLPGRAMGGALGGLLFGAKEMNPFSPIYGKRLKAVGGTKGLEEISKSEYNAIKGGTQRGKAYKFKGEGHLLPVYYKRKYSPGGAVGLIKKHPLMTAGGALLAYYLMKSPENRAMASSLVPRPDTGVSPETARQWQHKETENPFTKKTWG